MRECFYQECEGRTYVAPQYGHEIRVRVGEDLDRKNAVAISKEAMEELGIQEGDVVEICGAWMQQGETVLSSEEEITVVRMDKTIRQALPCARGQYIGIRAKDKG